ncbi:MAG: YIP1 family protein [Candidatus Hodarchaeota archaeon]
MSFKRFVENIGGFLVDPAGTTRERIQDTDTMNRAIPWLLVIIISITQGTAAWFMILYPEPWYYGLGPGTPSDNIPIIEDSNPVILVALVILLLAINLVYFNLIAGGLNFFIMKRLSKQERVTPSFRVFFSYYSYSLTPLFLGLPVAAFRLYFFGKITLYNLDFPFFDTTIQNILYVVILGVFYAWMYIIQGKMNESIFNVPRWKSAIPVLLNVAITMTCLFIVLPLILNAVIN